MTTPQQIQQAIEAVNDQQSFIQKLLIDTLAWQIPAGVEEIEDISYGWTQDQLNAEDLDQNVIGGQIYQIQPMHDDQPWGIFIVEFRNEAVFTKGRGLTGPLRKVLRGLVPNHRRQANRPVWDKENLLFICTHEYKYFRFAYFKSPKEKGHAEPLTMFGWSPDTPARTCCTMNLPHLAWPQDPQNTNKWIKDWSQAFNVESVTKKFYDDYKQVFENLQAALNLKKEDDRKMFAQVLMNRLMFLRFVERKGWLKFGEAKPKEYLKNLHQAGNLNGLSWYRSRLQVLFFEGLATPDHNKEDVIGQVPYLNGGLFTITPWDERAGDIDDRVFEPILGTDGLLYRYNFTVEESTPLDIEVAVDPEMLGKVFERLVTERKDTGSYYTPRTVVSFMCRESLKGYFGGEYAPLIDEHKTDNISVPQARELLQKLDEIKVVDPACGSGAYLLGMLQELFTLSKILDTRAETDDPHNDYQRKMQIIHNNIYGVDLDDFAVGIARLRLWLSLAVDFEGDEPDPLPNLDFKIEDGDSLTAPDPSGGFPTTFDALSRIKKIEQFDALKAEFMDPRKRAQHPQLKEQIDELRKEIASFTHQRQKIKGFDWRVEFAEVWSQKNGFDIVIANPPYGVDVDNAVRNQYFNQKSENESGQSKDTYGIFIARGLQLLRPCGTMSYIVSDTWRTIKSHRPLRKRILENTTVFHVLDLPPWIFDATVNTGIITLQKLIAPQDHKLIAGDLRGIEKDDWKTLSDNLIAVSGHGPDIQTEISARYTYLQNVITNFENLPFFIASPLIFGFMIDQAFERLGKTYARIEGEKVWNDDGICMIVSGIKTGNNSKYVRKRNENVRGSDLDVADMDSVLTDHEIIELSDEEKENGIKSSEKFLVPMDKGSISDSDSGWLPNYWVETEYFVDWSYESVLSMQNEPHSDLANPEFRFKRGITYSRTGQYAPTFRLSSGGILESKSCGLFVNDFDVELLLGILCSKVLRYLAKNYVMHSVETSVGTIGTLPIKRPGAEIAANIKSLVARIITNQKINPTYAYYENEQKEIDKLVYQLYGLNEGDIREVELWYCRRYPRLAEAQGALVEVKEKYSAHLQRCQRILEKQPAYWKSNPVLQLIAEGESHNLEFKETLEWDVRQNQHAAYLNKESLKTINAFLNTDGGTLLLGVADNGQIMGLERDLRHVHRNNLDGFELKLRNLIRDHLNPSPNNHVQINFTELAGGTICRVDVRPSATVTHFGNEVFIRDGNGSRKLEGRALTEWITQRNR
ncbi:MAG: Modification methylase TaqI [bacterium ADurb.Bin157]|nr:MAG: Modification methylase TaqI [bacterium ADurb.Bin157]